MALLGLIGAPQIAALLVLAQRGLEELHSARNTKALLANGATEAGGMLYPVVAATHLAWIAELFFLIPPDAPVIWPLIAYYLALQVVRYWVIGSLGRYWTTRIIVPYTEPLVARGPYRFLKHPNYMVVAAEIALLPVALGAWPLAIIFSIANAVVITWRIRKEETGLALRRRTV